MSADRKSVKASSKQVIDCIMQVIRLLPESVEDLPEGMRTRRYWEKTLSCGDSGRRAMELLKELPAFTFMRPAKPSAKAWRKLLEKDIGISQFANFLRVSRDYAVKKPCKRKAILRWRDAFGINETRQRVRPEESDDYLPNPHRGTATFQRFQGDPVYPTLVSSDTHGPVRFPKQGRIKDNIAYIPRSTVAYCRWPWAWLEPEKGKYNWELVDNALAAARKAGQTAQLRFQPYTMTSSMPAARGKSLNSDEFVNMPPWYWQTGAASLKNSAGQPCRLLEPDHNDPLYARHFGDFVRAFADRYDGHPDLESIDVAYGGSCGEEGGNSSSETAAALAEIYLDCFRKTQLLFMLGTEGQRHSVQKLKDSEPRRLGFRADCFGDLHLGNSPDLPEHLAWNHSFDAYPMQISEIAGRDSWKTAPVTMETCWNVAGWVCDNYDLDRIIHDGYRYHTSIFMPKSVFFPEKALDKLIEFDKYIGYRFTLRQILLPLEAKGGESISTEIFMDNLGCAPIYRNDKLALRFEQGGKSKIVKFAQDVRSWLPGHTWFKEKLIFPCGFSPGEVRLSIGITDDSSIPKVFFANKGRLDNGWLAIANMDIIQS